MALVDRKALEVASASRKKTMEPLPTISGEIWSRNDATMEKALPGVMTMGMAPPCTEDLFFEMSVSIEEFENPDEDVVSSNMLTGRGRSQQSPIPASNVVVRPVVSMEKQASPPEEEPFVDGWDVLKRTLEDGERTSRSSFAHLSASSELSDRFYELLYGSAMAMVVHGLPSSLFCVSRGSFCFSPPQSFSGRIPLFVETAAARLCRLGDHRRFLSSVIRRWMDSSVAILRCTSASISSCISTFVDRPSLPHVRTLLDEVPDGGASATSAVLPAEPRSSSLCLSLLVVNNRDLLKCIEELSLIAEALEPFQEKHALFVDRMVTLSRERKESAAYDALRLASLKCVDCIVEDLMREISCPRLDGVDPRKQYLMAERSSFQAERRRAGLDSFSRTLPKVVTDSISSELLILSKRATILLLLKTPGMLLAYQPPDLPFSGDEPLEFQLEKRLRVSTLYLESLCCRAFETVSEALLKELLTLRNFLFFSDTQFIEFALEQFHAQKVSSIGAARTAVEFALANAHMNVPGYVVSGSFAGSPYSLKFWDSVSFDFPLSLSFHLLVSERELSQYRAVSTQLLRFRAALFFIHRSFLDVKDLPQSVKRTRFQMLSFVSSILGYWMDYIEGVCWNQFQEEVTGPDCSFAKLRAAHIRFLNSVCSYCLLHESVRPLRGALSEAVASVLRFGGQISSAARLLKKDGVLDDSVLLILQRVSQAFVRCCSNAVLVGARLCEPSRTVSKELRDNIELLLSFCKVV